MRPHYMKGNSNRVLGFFEFFSVFDENPCKKCCKKNVCLTVQIQRFVTTVQNFTSPVKIWRWCSKFWNVKSSPANIFQSNNALMIKFESYSSWAMHNVQIWIGQIVFLPPRYISFMLDFRCNERCKYQMHFSVYY